MGTTEWWLMAVTTLVLLGANPSAGFPLDYREQVDDSFTHILLGLFSVVLIACSIFLLLGCVCCQKSNGFKQFHNPSATERTNDFVNPVSSHEFTIFTPLSSSQSNNNVFHDSVTNYAEIRGIYQNPVIYKETDASVRVWFNEPRLDFSRTKLKYIEKLGNGWFGQVVAGEAQQGRAKIPVVVRILDTTMSTQQQILFLKEVSLYKLCPVHPNVLSIFGHCFENTPLLVIQEYCAKGDLKEFLRNNKFRGEAGDDGLTLKLCYQLACGLKQLHEFNIVHKDLAARNCVLSADLTLKIGDYGLSCSKYPEDYYQGRPGLSVRWLAPESFAFTNTTLQQKQDVTKESNIWSFGITMWEIYEWGTQPYDWLTDDEVISEVFESHVCKLPEPAQGFHSQDLYRLMQFCWTPVEERPSVVPVHAMLHHLLQTYNMARAAVQASGLADFESRWQMLEPNTASRPTDPSSPTARCNRSPSLNNLHGSLDNLITDHLEQPGESEAVEERRPAGVAFDLPRPRSGSSSETEDETWRRRVEHGAYSEKVRQKSKSVTDLMVLTHIDCSDTDSETPLQSLEWPRTGSGRRGNVRQVAAARSGLEAPSLLFGSEGNLLAVQEAFQEELRKLQEERRDSLLFVPANPATCDSASVQSSDRSDPATQSPVGSDNDNSNNNDTRSDRDDANANNIISASSRREELVNSFNLEDFTSAAAIQPASQVYNVFSVIVNHDRSAISALKPPVLDTYFLHQEYEPASTLFEVELQKDASGSGHQSREAGAETESNGNADTSSDLVDSSCVVLGPWEECTIDVYSGLKTTLDKVDCDDVKLDDFRAGLLVRSESRIENESQGLDYSLNTWDNFLGESLDAQKEYDVHFDADSLPQINDEEAPFVEEEELEAIKDNEDDNIDSDGELKDLDLHGLLSNYSERGSVADDDLTDNSYSGFSLDEECEAALRNELAAKLPCAQGQFYDDKENEESGEQRDEVLVQYNVYNTPLSPIPEESCSDEQKAIIAESLRNETDSENEDWSEDEPAACPLVADAGDGFQQIATRCSPKEEESQQNHSPDSNCSNDTLFNVEDLACCGSSDNLLLVDAEKKETELPVQGGDEAEGGERLEEEEGGNNKSLEYFKLEEDEEGNDLDYLSNNFTDIRLPGSCDSQLMSTSFSESAESDGKDWESDGDDTDSTSSKDFIWKEGDPENNPGNEEDLQKLDDAKNSSESEEESTEDEDDYSPEFVPSAWDAMAAPTKSALKSPEKVNSENKKGVSFKKQKYHCIYEYPREPSPVAQKDHWNSMRSYADWELDIENQAASFDGVDEADGQNAADFSQYKFTPRDYYQLTSKNAEPYTFSYPRSSGMAYLEEDFFISSSARPFQAALSSSQFFPGQDWKESGDNVTPDSGIDDGPDLRESRGRGAVPSLKVLASQAANQTRPTDTTLGRLRHTRDKLKLDLPPSPNAFTTTSPRSGQQHVAFEFRPEKLKKSRFVVQHVETPTEELDQELSGLNVSFEALPPKPLRTAGKAIEPVHGEASLLDSADEDSGIESSHLERSGVEA